MKSDPKKRVAARLARVEGQVRGLGQMVDQDRYCLDVVAQVRAARSALAKVEQMVLADHLSTCVEHAIVSGDPNEQRKKVAEQIEVFSRTDR